MPPPQTRLTLEGIEDIETKQAATLSEIHSAIVQEVRNAKVWDNAWTLFTDYLCPAIIMRQERLQQQEQGHDRQTLSENDIRMIQYSISAMVRYAPSTAESNAVYVFFLQQCVPPIRDDPTINNCLVSLIYQYAQAKDLEIQARGLDLVKIALDRGVGLPSYSSHSSTHDHPRRQRFAPENSHNEHILVSVSRPILKLHQLRISADGTTLEPTGQGGAGAHRRNSSSSSQKQNTGYAPASPKANNNKAEGKHKESKEEGEGLKEVKEPKEVKHAKEPKEKKRDAKASKDNKDKDHNKDKDNQQQAPRPKRQPKLRQEGESASTDASSTAAGASISSSTPSSPSSASNNTRSHHRNSKVENAHSSNNKSPQQKPQESNNNKKSTRPNSPPKSSNDKKDKDKDEKKDEKKEPRSGLRSGGRAAFAGADRNNNRNNRDKETPSSSGRSSPRQILFVPASTNPKSDDSSSITSAAADVAAAGSASTSSASSHKRSSSRRTGAKKVRESTGAKESSGSGSLAKDMGNLKLDSAPVQA
ncbi:hypothetical protein BGZ93_003201 [Podila epicladia]|nr:hypothetical protein BGZ92_004085 [Podila epicladia]KAG0097206.1 hypothetical protein BGZ93_003201 [Podila epicladia]